MGKNTLEKIAALYTSNVRVSGLNPKSVGWNTPESQQLRFEKLTSVIIDRSKPVSINDFGCGYGAHLQYLVDICSIEVEEYNGYDLSSEMLSIAHSNLSEYSTTVNLFEVSRLSTVADYSFVSGTFNVRFKESDEVWKSYIHECLDNINQHSQKGFSFNLLSTYVDWKKPDLFYGDPMYWFDHCKQRYSSSISLLHDYPLYEWTIIVKKVD
ncbi:SAM-dependent methyltransferase [Candidatus Poribacteria bacterium]|nr:SAM-dependent methyltransferase [Candidatus Poribacteria bacterium]